MKKELKHYRIVSENGETLLISCECFQHLLETLDVLANGSCTQPEQKQYQKK